MPVADRTQPSTVRSKFRRGPSKGPQATSTPQGRGRRVNGRAPALYPHVTNGRGGGEDGLRLDRGEELGGARLLASDVRVASLLANEARHRAIDRVFGVPREQANLLTLIVLGLLLHATHDKIDQLLRGPGPPTRTDAALGGAVVRELLYDLGGPASRNTPLFATLLTFALLAGLSGPAARRSLRGIRASSHRTRVAFNHRYGHLVGRGQAHRHGRSRFVQMTKPAATAPHTNGRSDLRPGDRPQVSAQPSVGEPTTEASLT
jgi:hypothetical protein